MTIIGLTPISPNEVEEYVHRVPRKVIEIVNNMLLERKFKNRKITIQQEDVVSAIIEAGIAMRDEIFSKKMLDFEEEYAEYGWEVKYTRPSYCEDWSPYWEFSVKTDSTLKPGDIQ